MYMLLSVVCYKLKIKEIVIKWHFVYLAFITNLHMLGLCKKVLVLAAHDYSPHPRCGVCKILYYPRGIFAKIRYI